LTVGRRVRITGGPFAGLEGILKRKRNDLRVVVSLELIQQSLAVEVSGLELELVPFAPARTALLSANG
jgi:transcription antitermination factor NusG